MDSSITMDQIIPFVDVLGSFEGLFLASFRGSRGLPQPPLSSLRYWDLTWKKRIPPYTCMLFCAPPPNFHRETMGLEGVVSSFGSKGQHCMGGGGIFGDVKFQWANSDFCPKYWGGGGLLPMSKIPPQNGSCAQASAGIAVTDQCRHLLIRFAKSQKYPTCEVVRLGKRPRNGPTAMDLLLLLETLHTHKKSKKGEKKCQKKTDIHESQEKIRAHRVSSKATRLFLTK